MPDTMLSYATPPNAVPSIDVVAVHASADKEVDEIYRLTGRLRHGLSVLREVAGRITKGTEDWEKLNFLADTLEDSVEAVLDANDRLNDAIDPLNPFQEEAAS